MEWVLDHIEVVISVASAVIALFGAWLAHGETRRQRKLLELELRQRIDASSLNWGNEAIDTLSEASALALSNHLSERDLVAAKLDIARRLSALADRGRLFFPNIEPDGSGTDKDFAFRGSRPPILDTLVFACHEAQRLFEAGVEGADSARFITDCRRLFVSELQCHLDPNHLDGVIERYTEQTSQHRGQALNRAGELAIEFDLLRPGILAQTGAGWSGLISAERRKTLLREHRQAVETHDS